MTEIETLKAELKELKKAEDKASRIYYKSLALRDILKDVVRWLEWNEDKTVADSWEDRLGGYQNSFTKQFNKKSCPWFDRHLPTATEIAELTVQTEKLHEVYKSACADTSKKRATIRGDEKKIRKAKKRAIEIEAGKRTCPCCFRTMALVSGTIIARHGWTESGGRRVGEYGNAWHSGSCYGVDELPFEVSCEGTKKYHSRLVASRDGLLKEASLDKSQLRHLKDHDDAIEFLEEKISNWKPKSQ
jgi:hypothetical protein